MTFRAKHLDPDKSHIAGKPKNDEQRSVRVFWVKPWAKTPRPRITAVNPSKVSPAVYIGIEGQWLGAHEGSEVLILFIQGGVTHSEEAPGAGAVDADPNGLQFLDARVPDKLREGTCQLVLEVKGRRSEPFNLEISSAFTPPVVTSLHPKWVRPGEGVLIRGLGFSGSDKFELTDSTGQVHEIEGSKSAETAHFPLPNSVSDGAAALRMVEHRSGRKQRSNGLGLIISHGPVPLELLFRPRQPLAPGQSLLMSAYGNKALSQATAVEVELTQAGSSRSVFVKDLKNLRFEIPYEITSGRMEIRNRTWRDSIASEWSDPVSYQVGDRPAPPSIHNIQRWPKKAEAVFVQDGKVVATVPIILDGLPRIRVPGNLKPGSITVERRFRRAGRLFKGPSTGYSCCPLGSVDGVLNMTDSDDWIFPLPGRTQTVQMLPGEVLVVEADFNTQNPAELGIELVCGRRHRQLNIKPWYENSSQQISARIPGRLRGTCSLTIENVALRTKAKLPIALRIK